MPKEKAPELTCAQCGKTRKEAGIRSWEVESEGLVMCRYCSFHFEFTPTGQVVEKEWTVFINNWNSFFLSMKAPRLDMAWKGHWEGEYGNVCVVESPWNEIVFRCYIPIIGLEAALAMQLISQTVEDFVKNWDKTTVFTRPFDTTFDIEVEIANTYEHQRAFFAYKPFVVSVSFINLKTGVIV